MRIPTAARSLPATPTPAQERLPVLDVLRGAAVLRVLTMNISLALPGASRLNPIVAGGFAGIDRAVWWIGYLLWDEKMITLLSMLFGAGLVLQTRRTEARGHAAPWVFYRRQLSLLWIGLVHAYLVWEGDILVTYAMCGMLLYPLRHRRPRTLALLAVLVWLPSVPLTLGFASFLQQARETTPQVERARAQGQSLTLQTQKTAPVWEEVRRSFHPTPEETAEEIRAVRQASYWGMVRRRAPEAFQVETTIFGLSLGWTVGARMLLGMALVQWGVLTAAGRRLYRQWAVIGYVLGLPLAMWGGYQLVQHRFDAVFLFGGGSEWNNIGSLLVALGHGSVVALAVHSGWLPWLTVRLGAVGRMALTNYLAQSLIATTLFYGYGLGWFGRLSRSELIFIVAAIWLTELTWSPWWLHRFRFGPVEWLWRLLAYGRWQRWQLANSPDESQKSS